MDKRELLRQIQSFAEKNLITKEELLEAFDQSRASEAKEASTTQSRLSNILYFIGGTVVFLGIVILIGQNWEQLNDATKIFATLGAGIAAYLVGALFIQYQKLNMVSQAFFFISGLVIPIGIQITFDIAQLDISSSGMQSLVSVILLVTFGASYVFFRRIIFVIFTIIFGTWFFFAFTDYLLSYNIGLATEKFFYYRVLLVNLTYMILGYAFSEGEYRPISRWLYGFGAFGFLGAALALGDWKPHQSVFWELIYPGLVFGILFLSIHLQTRTFLVFGSLYLMAYIMKITFEYFTEGLGWPLSLVLVGFALMGIGYMAFYLNKKYMRFNN